MVVAENEEYRELTLSEAAPGIRDADQLLFRSRGIISKVIRAYTQGKHSHAAKASWSKGVLECVEVREFIGGRITPLHRQVEKFPGQIDVYHANAIERPEWTPLEWQTLQSLINGLKDSQKEYKKLIDLVKEFGKGRYCRQGADTIMRSFGGTAYGYGTVFKTSLASLPGVRFWFPPDFDDNAVGLYPPDCSAAVAIADRLGGGFDQLKNRSDMQTTPADIAGSPFNQYFCTLVPDKT